MVFPLLGVNEMEGFVAPFETIFDERAKHAVLFVDAVEERANVTTLAETTPGKLQGMPVGFHVRLHAESHAERVAFSPGTRRSGDRPARSRTQLRHARAQFHGWTTQDTPSFALVAVVSAAAPTRAQGGAQVKTAAPRPLRQRDGCLRHHLSSR